MPLHMEVRPATDVQILTPLGIAPFKSSKPAPVSATGFGFVVTLRGAPADSIEVLIENKHAQLKTFLPRDHCQPGTHCWFWDSYNQAGVLDTKSLKDGCLRVTFSARRNSEVQTQSLAVHAAPAEEKWVDVAVDKTHQQITVEVRAKLLDGGQIDSGLILSRIKPVKPTTEVACSEQAEAYPRFVDLQRLAVRGFVRYWSGSVVAPNGDKYALNAGLLPAQLQAMPSLTLALNSRTSWCRSSNPGRVRGFYSFCGNFLPRRIVYNIGLLEHKGRRFRLSAEEADAAFALTAAHEIGHEILSAYGGDRYSYSHRGTSTLVTQCAKKPEEGGEIYPCDGAIDLMKYYTGPRPQDFFARINASDQDLQSLLWLASLKMSLAN